jgi:hypothetical protein
MQLHCRHKLSQSRPGFFPGGQFGLSALERFLEGGDFPAKTSDFTAQDQNSSKKNDNSDKTGRQGAE